MRYYVPQLSAVNNGEESQERRCTCECAPYFFLLRTTVQVFLKLDDRGKTKLYPTALQIRFTVCFNSMNLLAVLRTADLCCE